MDLFLDVGNHPAEKVADKSHAHDPEDAAKNVVGNEAPVLHFSHTSHNRSEGSQDRDKAGDENGESTILIIKFLGGNEMFAVEEKRVFAGKNHRPALEPDAVANCVAKDSGQTEHNVESPKIQITPGGENPCGDQQRIAGQKKTHEQTGLGKDNDRQGQQAANPDQRFDVINSVEPIPEKLHIAFSYPSAASITQLLTTFENDSLNTISTYTVCLHKSKRVDRLTTLQHGGTLTLYTRPTANLELSRVTKQKTLKRIFLFTALLAGLLGNSTADGQVVARFFYDEKGNVIRQERDTNGDGKMDRWIFYDSEGKIERIEQDEDVDGKPDLWLYYEKGKLKREEISSKRNGRIDLRYFFAAQGEVERKEQDTNGDGKPDVWVFYENKQPVRSEEDRNFTGRVDRLVYFEAGKISRVEEDTNGDGRMDSFSYFQNGPLVRKEIDRKHAGRIDLWGYYQDGRLLRQEEDLNGDGKVDRILYFQGEQLVRREEDSRGKGQTDLIESFSGGKLARRLTDGKGDGKYDTLYVFKDNKTIREERDTDGDGYFDLRIFFDENGRELRQEADTNRDRRVDVWVTYKDGKRAMQEEDLNFNGRVDVRYFFKDDHVVKQQQVAEAEPDTSALPFASIQDELRSMAVEVEQAAKKIATGAAKEQEADKR